MGAHQPEDRRVAYQEVSKNLQVIDDFRARLLALLPISSGAGIFLLLTTGDEDDLGAIGLVGGLVAVGLFVFELRQIRVCRHLIRVGARLEQDMGFDPGRGQFLGRPAPSSSEEIREVDVRFWRRQTLLPSVPKASLIVYGTVIGAWGYLAYLGFS